MHKVWQYAIKKSLKNGSGAKYQKMVYTYIK